MRRIAAALFAPLLCAFAQPAAAQAIAYAQVVEEEVVWLDAGSDRVLAAAPAPIPRGPISRSIAAYGPFRVLGDGSAALVDVTDSRSPADFAAMLRAFPHIAVIEMVECPGTDDDLANLRLGRMIRAHGIATHVPAGGSVRSGAVELFLAGAERRIDDGAEFAVHAWSDEDGRQAGDYPANAQENLKYLAYYREMGMSGEEAAAVYAMTNSVPFEQARWLDADDMRHWVQAGQPAGAPGEQRQLANLDLRRSLR